MTEWHHGLCVVCLSIFGVFFRPREPLRFFTVFSQVFHRFFTGFSRCFSRRFSRLFSRRCSRLFSRSSKHVISFRRVSSWAGLVSAWGGARVVGWRGMGACPAPPALPGAKPGSPVGLVRGFIFVLYIYHLFLYMRLNSKKNSVGAQYVSI